MTELAARISASRLRRWRLATLPSGGVGSVTSFMRIPQSDVNVIQFRILDQSASAGNPPDLQCFPVRNSMVAIVAEYVTVFV
jgi:hypothetical protein